MTAMNAKRIMKKAAEASTGIAVTVAFLNVALLVLQLVKTVTTDEMKRLLDEEGGAE